MNRDRASDTLRHAARRASRHRFFLAADLEEFRAHRGMEEVELATFLGCGPELLPKVALCRRPDPTSPRFRLDLHRVAQAFSLAPDRLVSVIREVDALRALKEASQAATASQGLLLAAREVHEPPDQPPAEREGEDEESGDKKEGSG